MKSKTFDSEKWELCLHSDFILYEGYIFLTIKEAPKSCELEKLAKRLRRTTIERDHNRVDLSTVTEDISKQREIALELWGSWRKKLDKLFPDEEVFIEIDDKAHGVVVHAYRATPKE